MSDDQQMLDCAKQSADLLYKWGCGEGSCAIDDLIRKYEQMKAEWIDPQRLVDLAQRFQDNGGAATLALWFENHADDLGMKWGVELPNGGYRDGKTAADALKAAEA